MDAIVLTKPSIILMFSGGLDSLGAWHELLINKEYSDYQIHAHHVDIENIENRALAETIACNNIVDWYTKNQYNPSYSSSKVALATVNRTILWDNDIVKFVGGQIAACADKYVMKVAYGVTKDDAGPQSNMRFQRGSEILKFLAPHTEIIYPIRHLTKLEVLQMLPKELADLSWSCRYPRYDDGKPIKCGNCRTCTDLAKIGL